MKSVIALVLSLAFSVIMMASDVKTLVVYYTYSGVTETLAQTIAEDCSGGLLEVIDHGNYPRPESSTTYSYANNERSQIDEGNWPEINTAVESLDAYDAVIICTPLWNGKMANPMLTFLHNHSALFEGKQVALAVTSWSSGITSVVNDAHTQLPSAVFVGTPLHINYNNRGNISTMAAEWVSTLQFDASTLDVDHMRVVVGNRVFAATLANNETAQAFKQLLPLSLYMTELNGNEKYNYLNTTLPSHPVNPGTIHTGDIMLYGNSCVVLFYKTFNTSYTYTSIGVVDDPTGLAETLGANNVNVYFELVSHAMRGDVNSDGEVSIGDVTTLINYLLRGTASSGFCFGVADANGDGELNIGDVTTIINILLKGE